MKIRKLILENFDEATKEFIEISGNQAEVQQTVEKFKQLANQEAFPENQQDINFWRMRGWKQFKAAVDQASEVASASATVDTTSGDYKDAEAKLQSLLNQNPLNHKAILPILSSSKNPQQSYRYIITASRYADKPVAVPADVLVNAVKYTESDQGIFYYVLASSVDFTKVSNNTLNILTKISPTFLGEAYKFLSTEQQAIIATDPEVGLKFAIQNKKRAPAFEKAIGANAENAYTYCYELKLNSFPAGEDALAKDPKYASYYAAYILNGPFPKGEKAIIKDVEATTRYIVDALDRKPFPAGEAIIAKYPEKAIWYATNISNKRWPKEVEEKIFRLKTDDKNTYVKKFKIKLDDTGLAERKTSEDKKDTTSSTAKTDNATNTASTASSSSSSSANSSYFIYTTKQEGPFPAKEIADRIVSKNLANNVYVWKDGFDNWVEADKDEELSKLINKSEPVGGNSAMYHYAIGNEAKGPVSTKQLVDMLLKQELKTTDQVWAPSLSNWTVISKVADLAALSAPYQLWYNNATTTPIKGLDILNYVKQNVITSESFIKYTTGNEWMQIKNVVELKSFL